MSVPLFLIACAVLIRCMMPDRHQLAAWRELRQEFPIHWPMTIIGMAVFMASFWVLWTMLPA